MYSVQLYSIYSVVYDVQKTYCSFYKSQKVSVHSREFYIVILYEPYYLQELMVYIFKTTCLIKTRTAATLVTRQVICCQVVL